MKVAYLSSKSIIKKWETGHIKHEIGLFYPHLYGRASDAEIQKFPESVYLPDRSTGFYDSSEPLSQEDISALQKHISLLEKEPKYQWSEWGIVL